MLYNRSWFDNDKFALTLGGGAMNNPGRYLVLLPPINGATAFSGTPYFTRESRGSVQGLGRVGHVRLHARPVHDVPVRVRSSRGERAVLRRPGRRDANRGNAGSPAIAVPGFLPDLRKAETRFGLALLVKL